MGSGFAVKWFAGEMVQGVPPLRSAPCRDDASFRVVPLACRYDALARQALATRRSQRAVTAPSSVVATAEMDAQETFAGVSGLVVEAACVDGSLEDDDDVTVEPCGEVAVGIEDWQVVCGDAEAWDWNDTHQRPVADEPGRQQV